MKIKTSDFLALVSALGTVAFMVIDLYEGISIFWVDSTGLIIIPFLLIYAYFFLEMLLSLFAKSININKIKAVSHLIVIITALSIFIFQSEWVKSEKIIEAKLIEDLHSYTLVFRKNGDVELISAGYLGLREKSKGQYIQNDNYLIFTKNPNKNMFPNDTLIFDKKANIIFTKRSNNENFDPKNDKTLNFNVSINF